MNEDKLRKIGKNLDLRTVFRNICFWIVLLTIFSFLYAYFLLAGFTYFTDWGGPTEYVINNW